MVDKKSYKQLQSELDSILTQLQSADLDIDKAMDLYKKGQTLVTQIEDYLKNAKNNIVHLKKS